MDMKHSIDLKRTALAMFRAAAGDDDAGLAALQATVDDERDGAVIGQALNEIGAAMLALPPGVDLDEFYAAYGRAIDRTERKLTGQ